MENILIWLFMALLFFVSAEFYKVESNTRGRINGQIMIGGLAMVHDSHGINNVNCNLTKINSHGIQRVEAMRYAVSQINKNNSLLPGLTFGLEVRDTCGSETRALDESLQFIDRVPVCENNTKRDVMFGVVGPSTSLITAEVANLLRLFRIPLVSYAATSIELSDKTKYDFLLRTVPPDSFQADAMADFIDNELAWKSVFVLYSTGSYGEYGYEAFKIAIEKENVKTCIADQVKIPTTTNTTDMRKLLHRFRNAKSNNKVRGIVCYCELHDIQTLINAADSDQAFSDFRFIGGDTFVLGPKSNKSIIFSLHYNVTDLKDFNENWYSKLNPSNVNATENPWFEDFWIERCNGSEANCSLCEHSLTAGVVCPRDDKVAYTIDAVYSFAHAIHNALQDYNGSVDELTKLVNRKDDNFFKNYLKKVDFQGLSGRVQFNDSIVRGSYDINQFDEEGKLRLIGTWDWEGLRVISRVDRNRFYVGDSSCKPECKPEERRVPFKNCCWACDRCKPNDYIASKTNCMPCGRGKKPNASYTGCYDLKVIHISLSWKVVLCIIATCGVIATLFTIKTFISHNNTPLVKGSGRELSYVLLFGILMLFCIPFLLLADPHRTICGIARFSVGLMLCVCYSALLIKTNRIARIFSGRQNLLFLTPNWQLLLATFLLMPQILIGAIGLIEHPPVFSIDYSFPSYGVKKCNSETPDLIVSISYNLVLVFLTTYYAFRTRKVPANFNEARFIGFVMYTTCVLWLAFLPVFYGTSSEYKTIFIILNLTMNAATLLIGLFGIKLYIILLRPDKNSRTNSKLRSITFCSEGNYSFGGFNLDSTVTLEAKMESVSSQNGLTVRYTKSTTEASLVLEDEETQTPAEESSIHDDVFTNENTNEKNGELRVNYIPQQNNFHRALRHTLTL